MTDKVLSFIDCETGGLDESRHALLEVAVVKTDPSGEVLSMVEVPVRLLPGRVVTAEAFALHGLDGSEGADPSVAFDQLRAVLTGTIPAGYNLQFDLRFLRQLCLDVGAEFVQGEPVAWLDHHKLDVSALAMPLWLSGVVESCSLGKVALALGCKVWTPAHRALSDCLTTIEVYRRLLGSRRPLGA